jgi:hypothetical protein
MAIKLSQLKLILEQSRNKWTIMDKNPLHDKNHRIYLHVKEIACAYIGSTHISLWKLIPRFNNNNKLKFKELRIAIK